MRALASQVAITVEPSPFEEPFLGGPVRRLRIVPDVSIDTLGAEVAGALERASDEGTRLMSCRLPARDGEQRQVLLDSGFRLIETLITLRRPTEPLPEVGAEIGFHRESEIAACVEIGRTAFATDRYHADPRISDAVADALKALWVENALRGRAEVALVARDGAGAVVGFNLIVKGAKGPTIDLIAIAEAQRGKRFGRALVAAGLAQYHGKADAMFVGTQAENRAALALYDGLGFVAIEEQVTLHWTA